MIPDYTQRQILFQMEPRKWYIESDRLRWEEDASTKGEIFFAGIETFNLRHEPKLFQHNRYLLVITEKSGLKHYITSHTLKGFLNYQPQFASYRDFVEKLTKALIPYKEHIWFRVGINPLLFRLQTVLLGCALLVFCFILIFSSQNPNYIYSLMKLCIFAALAFVGLRQTFRRRPENFSPDAIPERGLPPKS